MANVHLKAGKAEIALAKALWERGFRYRKNYKKLPGSPDIAVLRSHIAIFVDGELWHGKDWETKKKHLKSNRNTGSRKSKKILLETSAMMRCLRK